MHRKCKLVPNTMYKQDHSPPSNSFSGFTDGSDPKESACDAGDPGLIPGQGRCLAKGMATHSSIPV